MTQVNDKFDPNFAWKVIFSSLGVIVVIALVAGISYQAGIIEGFNSKDKNSLSTNPSLTISPKTIITSPSPTFAKTKTITLKGQKNLGGFVTSAGNVDIKRVIQIGGNDSFVSRGFVSFDLTPIPKNANINSALLRIFQTNTQGNPYKSGGKLLVDHVAFGNEIEKTDYAKAALVSGFNSLTGAGTIGWRETDITNLLAKDYLDLKPNSQYRIHFENELKGQIGDENFALFESSNNSEETGNTPEIIIKYN